MKVGYVIGTSAGGTERHVRMLADGLAAGGVTVSVYGPAATWVAARADAAADVPAGTRAGASAGCTSGSESTRPDMREWERPPLRILRPTCRHAYRASLGRPAYHRFRQRFSGLRSRFHLSATGEFHSFLFPCTLIAHSSSTASRGFLLPDVSSTA